MDAASICVKIMTANCFKPNLKSNATSCRKATTQQIQAKLDAPDDDEQVKKKHRVDSLDDIDPIVTLTVDVGGERKEVRVLPTAHKAHNLRVELTTEALTLLLSMPDGEDAAPFMPEIPCECPNVGWRGGIGGNLGDAFLG